MWPTSLLTCPKSANAADRVEEETGWRFEDCRTAGETMSGPNTGLLSHARAQLDWNLRHGFCSVCGHPTDKKRGGQMRQCPACNAQHFPRTDPVVITVVADVERDRCLLGQSRGRLQRMRAYSALAGFMDQGEAIEEAVAREVMEEAGIRVKNVRYHSSQPWPFPSSLMIGCLAEADTTDINMDDEEMTDVRWFRPLRGVAGAGRAERGADGAGPYCHRPPPDQGVGHRRIGRVVAVSLPIGELPPSQKSPDNNLLRLQ